MLVCPLCTLFSEMSLHVFCPFSNWIVLLLFRFDSSLYIPATSSFVGYVVSKYILPLCILSLLLNRVSNRAKVLLGKFNLSLFPFMDYAFLIKSSKPLPSPIFCRFFPVFNISVIDLYLTFKFIMHFE